MRFGKPERCSLGDQKLQKVRAVVRIRPFNDKESPITNVRIDNDHESSIQLSAPEAPEETTVFNLDGVHGPERDQKAFYDAEIRPFVPSVLRGLDTTIFAYGMTGAGKTYTMCGGARKEIHGMIPRTVEHLFQLLKRRKNLSEADYSFHTSYLEIYNEKAYDLFSKEKAEKAADLPIREDKSGHIFVAGLSEERISNYRQFMALYEKAQRFRTTAATKINSCSTRSHAVCIVKVRVRAPSNSRGRINSGGATAEKPTATDLQSHLPPPPMRENWLCGRLNLIDLAGSEDNRRTGNQGARLAESGSINKSLFVLGKVISALNAGEARIPYRDSKLTRMLQNSLGGSGQSILIANISPSEEWYSLTHSALSFACKTRKVVCRPTETIERRAIACKGGGASSLGQITAGAESSGVSGLDAKSDEDCMREKLEAWRKKKQNDLKACESLLRKPVRPGASGLANAGAADASGVPSATGRADDSHAAPVPKRHKSALRDSGGPMAANEKPATVIARTPPQALSDKYIKLQEELGNKVQGMQALLEQVVLKMRTPKASQLVCATHDAGERSIALPSASVTHSDGHNPETVQTREPSVLSVDGALLSSADTSSQVRTPAQETANRDTKLSLEHSSGESHPSEDEADQITREFQISEADMLMTPKTRLRTAKEHIVSGRKYEKEANLREAIGRYRRAQRLLPGNAKLKATVAQLTEKYHSGKKVQKAAAAGVSLSGDSSNGEDRRKRVPVERSRTAKGGDGRLNRPLKTHRPKDARRVLDFEDKENVPISANASLNRRGNGNSMKRPFSALGDSGPRRVLTSKSVPQKEPKRPGLKPEQGTEAAMQKKKRRKEQQAVDLKDDTFTAEREDVWKLLEKKLLDVLNNGNVKQLLKLPAIGKKRAEKILDARDEGNTFYNINDLHSMAGIPKKTIEGFLQRSLIESLAVT